MNSPAFFLFRRCGVLLAVLLAGTVTRAQFVANVPVSSGVYRYGNSGNWTGGIFSGVFTNNTGVSTILFQSTDVSLPSGLSFTFSNSNSLNLEATGGPYTLSLGGDISVNNATTSMITIGSTSAGSELNVNLTGARTFTIAGGNLLLMPNVVSGTAGLTKAGAGTLKFTGTNTYTGGTTVTGGVLQLGDFSNSLDGSVVGGATNGIAISSGASVLFFPFSTTRYSGVISGAGSITKDGSALLELDAVNTYTGGTTVTAGTLRGLAVDALPTTGSVSVASGATLDLTFDQTLAGLTGLGTTQITSGRTLTINSSGNSQFDGVISQTAGAGGALTKAGSGTFTLTGTNTYAGGTTINGGTLEVSSDANLGNSAGSLSFGGGTLKATSTVTSSRSIFLNAGGGTLNTNTYSVTLSGIISGAGAFVHQGSGILTLSGTNTFTGGTTVQSGTLVFSTDANLGANGSTVTLNNGFLKMQAAIASFSHPITLASGGGFINTNGLSSTIASAITGSGNLSIQSSPANGVLTLTGGGNTYTGSTFIESGATLNIGAANTLPTTTKVSIAGGATLDVAFDQIVAGISSTGTAQIASGKQLTVNATSTGLQFDGVISGAGIFVKDGASTLNLNGANTYSGGTILKAGTLILLNPNALGTAGTITFGGGTLQFNTNNATDYSARFSGLGSQLYNIDTNGQNVTFASPISSSGGTLTKLGSGTLTLSASNSYTGGTTINAGYLVIGADGALPGNVTFTGSINAGGGELRFSTGPTNILISGTITGPGQVTQLGTGAVSLSGANTYTGATNVSSGTLNAVNASGSATGTGTVIVNSGATLQIGTGGTVGSVSGNIANNGTVLFNRSDASTYAGVISGPSSGTVSINGTGVTTFTGANTYASTTIIGNNATLALANAGGQTLASSTDVSFGSNSKLDVTVNQTVRGLISSSSTSTIAIAAGKTLTSNLPANQSNQFAGIVSGTGSFTKDGPGTLTFTADQPFVGNVTVAGGILQFGNGGTSGGFGGNITVNSGASLSFNRSDTTPVNYSGIISGSGGFTKSGSSTLVLSGTNNFSGGVAILGGTLKVGVANAVPNVSVDVSSGATLDVANNTTIAMLSGSGSTTVAAGKTLRINTGQGLGSLISGAGNVELGGVTTMLVNQTYTGTTTVKSGTLNFGSNGNGTGSPIGSVAGDIVLAGGDGVIVNRSDALTYAGAISGAGFLNQSGPGTLTLTGANTYTGTTAVLKGTLKIGAVNALPTTTSVSVSGGATLDVAANQTITSFGASNSFSSILLEASQILNVTLGASTTGTVFGGSISGAGGFQVGPSSAVRTVTLTADNTYTGGTTIDSGGALRLGAETAAGMISGNVVDNGILIFQRTSGATMGGVISGTGIVQQGTIGGTVDLGDTKLTAANTYTGGTQVFRGTLIAANLSGSATGSGAVTVQYNGVFAGAGSISGPLNVNAGGTVAPFASSNLPGTLKVGATTFAGGGRFGFGITNPTGVAGTDYSLLSISGALSISATSAQRFTVSLYSFSGSGVLGPLAGFDSSQSYSWTFATATGGITGFDAAAYAIDTSKFGSTFPGSFSVGLSGNSLLLQYSPTAVPEPSTWALLALGLGTVLMFSWRGRRSAGR